MDTREVKKRFLEYIGSSFMYSDDGHQSYRYGPRSFETLSNAQFIHLPKNKFQYIGIDLDREGSASLWMDEGYPEPTITIISPKTSHSKYFYELSNPVILPLNWTTGKANMKPYNYLKNVKAGLDAAMNGDKSYSGSTMNNPFYKNLRKEIIRNEDGIVNKCWKVHWADKTYDLVYLSEYAKLVRKSFRHDCLYDPLSREKTMFNLTRVDAYRIVRNYSNLETFHEMVKNLAIDHWQQLSLVEKDHDLNEAEAECVATSVAKWTWQHRESKWLDKFNWNLGILNFNRIERESISKEDVESEIRRRRQLGAEYAHKAKISRTKHRIEDACIKLIENGEKLSRKNISSLSGVGESTLTKYKHLIKNYKVFINHIH